MSRFLATAAAAALATFASAQQRDAGDMLARIRTEGSQRSGALALYRTLTDDIGARLTGSPSHVRAARWVQERFAEWRLTDPHLEPYDFGRGWQFEKISVEMTEPRYMPLIAYPDAWSPGTKGPVSGRVVYVGDKTTAQVRALGEQLRGAIVLTHLPVTEWVTRDRPQPGVNESATPTGNPALPQPKSTAPPNELLPLLRTLGAAAALRPSAYRDRTIGVVIWSGEEQGLLGARAYLAQHFATPADRDRLFVYLNDDPGSGRTLGFYMETNAAAKTVFDRWLAPLKDLGATRNVIEAINATDHVPFQEAGLPGFNVIKEFAAYDERTRHTNADYPDRMSEDALKQSAIFMATFAWQAAMTDERLK